MFKKSPRSNGSGGNNCVEVDLDSGEHGIVLVRDSKDRSGPVLDFTDAEWQAFIEGVKRGEFDLPANRVTSTSSDPIPTEVHTMTGNDEQVHDQGTEVMPGEQVANAAAETLHGGKAREEKYEQDDAVVLPGGNTLIAERDATADEGEGSDNAPSAQSNKGVQSAQANKANKGAQANKGA